MLVDRQPIAEARKAFDAVASAHMHAVSAMKGVEGRPHGCSSPERIAMPPVVQPEVSDPKKQSPKIGWPPAAVKGISIAITEVLHALRHLRVHLF
jgi:hypothetical protein